MPSSQALLRGIPVFWPVIHRRVVFASHKRRAVPQVRRLAKAARHADVLASLATQRGDTRTALEAQAYASLMTGTWLMEKETDWSTALKKLERTQCAPVQGQQVLANDSVDAFNPLAHSTVRFWMLQMKRYMHL